MDALQVKDICNGSWAGPLIGWCFRVDSARWRRRVARGRGEDSSRSWNGFSLGKWVGGWGSKERRGRRLNLEEDRKRRRKENRVRHWEREGERDGRSVFRTEKIRGCSSEKRLYCTTQKDRKVWEEWEGGTRGLRWGKNPDKWISLVWSVFWESTTLSHKIWLPCWEDRKGDKTNVLLRKLPSDVS